MQAFHFRWLPLPAFGFLLAVSIGLSGCGSKPSDGTVIEEGAKVDAEQKSKVQGFYGDRVKKVNKKTSRKK